MCDSTVPAIDLTSSGENMLIKFVTDSFGHDKGFRFYVKFLEFSADDGSRDIIGKIVISE